MCTSWPSISGEKLSVESGGFLLQMEDCSVLSGVWWRLHNVADGHLSPGAAFQLFFLHPLSCWVLHSVTLRRDEQEQVNGQGRRDDVNRGPITTSRQTCLSGHKRRS